MKVTNGGPGSNGVETNAFNALHLGFLAADGHPSGDGCTCGAPLGNARDADADDQRRREDLSYHLLPPVLVLAGLTGRVAPYRCIAASAVNAPERSRPS
jgi:hypothetical protein